RGVTGAGAAGAGAGGSAGGSAGVGVGDAGSGSGVADTAGATGAADAGGAAGAATTGAGGLVAGGGGCPASRERLTVMRWNDGIHAWRQTSASPANAPSTTTLANSKDCDRLGAPCLEIARARSWLDGSTTRSRAGDRSSARAGMAVRDTGAVGAVGRRASP